MTFDNNITGPKSLIMSESYDENPSEYLQRWNGKTITVAKNE